MKFSLSALALLSSMVPFVTGCSPDSPCEECTGDCKSDNDCADGLVCFQQVGRANRGERDGKYSCDTAQKLSEVVLFLIEN
jgi:hypothetical protein